MARLDRVVIAGVPYHLTHRGNRRGDVFFADEDRWTYLHGLAAAKAKFGLRIWGWCLMSNHVHLLAVPERADSLARAIGLAHGRHSRRVNASHGWSGHLWASRFFSTPLDGAHLWSAIRYIELNPVRAGLVERAEQWTWSSARAHALGVADVLLEPDRPFAAGARDALTGRPLAWGEWLARGLAADEIEMLRRATRTGRPCGDEAFIKELEHKSGRALAPLKRGRKPN
jgi:putative transposase